GADWSALKEDLDLGRAGAALTASEAKDIQMLVALGRAPIRQWHADALNENLHHKRRMKAICSLLAAGVPVSTLGRHLAGFSRRSTRTAPGNTRLAVAAKPPRRGSRWPNTCGGASPLTRPTAIGARGAR